jgi:hypothetical protein
MADRMDYALVTIEHAAGKGVEVPHIGGRTPMVLISVRKWIYESLRALGFDVEVHKEPWDAAAERNAAVEAQAAAAERNAAVAEPAPPQLAETAAPGEAAAAAAPIPPQSAEAKLPEAPPAAPEAKLPEAPPAAPEAKLPEAPPAAPASVPAGPAAPAGNSGEEPQGAEGSAGGTGAAEVEGVASEAHEAADVTEEDLEALRAKVEAMVTLEEAKALIAENGIEFGAEGIPAKLKDIKASVLKMIEEAKAHA